MVLDLIAALIITFGFYKGYSNGLIDTIVNTLSILVGLVAAITFSPYLIDYLKKVVNLPSGLDFILSMLIIFFAVMLLLRFIADKFEDLLKAVKINFLNQLAGGALLGFVFAFLLGMLLLMLTNFNIITEETANQSTLYKYLVQISQEGGWVIDIMKNLFADFWEKFNETVNAAKENLEK